MIFSYAVNTPASTTKEIPLVTPLPIGRGVIHFWSILFPPGSLGSVRLYIKKGGVHILPDNTGGFLLGNKTEFKGEDFKFVDREPYVLQAYSWNLDPRHDHELYIRIFQKDIRTFSPYSEYLNDMVEKEELLKVY